MSFPDVKTIIIIVFFNVLMFTISYSMATFFGTTAEAVPTFTIPTVPTYVWTDIISVIASITDTVVYISDWIGLFVSILTFDNIEGLPDTIRAFVTVPILLANAYVLFTIVSSLVEILEPLIPG